MSFLLEEAESAATLTDALALLDSWDPSTGSVNGTSPSPISEAGDSSGSSRSSANPEELEIKRKKRRASDYSLKFQRRKKEELLVLRDEVAALEAELEHLRLTKRAPCTEDGRQSRQSTSHCTPVKAGWHRTAIVKFHERQRAENTKRKLLALARKQVGVNESVRRLLQKSAGFEEFESLLQSRPLPTRHPLAQLDHSSLLISQLERVVEGMRMDMNFTCASVDASSTSSKMLIKHADQGKMVEITTTTPMACSMQVASSWLWENLSTLREYPDKSYNYLRWTNPDTVEKNYLMTLRGQARSMQVNGLQLLRKYEEPNRVILVRSNFLVLPTESLRFRNNCWTTITPADGNAQCESVVRTCVQLYAECKEGLSVRPEDFETAKNLVLDALSGMYRDHSQTIQNALIEESGGGTMTQAA